MNLNELEQTYGKLKRNGLNIALHESISEINIEIDEETAKKYFVTQPMLLMEYAQKALPENSKNLLTLDFGIDDEEEVKKFKFDVPVSGLLIRYFTYRDTIMTIQIVFQKSGIEHTYAIFEHEIIMPLNN